MHDACRDLRFSVRSRPKTVPSTCAFCAVKNTLQKVCNKTGSMGVARVRCTCAVSRHLNLGCCTFPHIAKQVHHRSHRPTGSSSKIDQSFGIRCRDCGKMHRRELFSAEIYASETHESCENWPWNRENSFENQREWLHHSVRYVKMLVILGKSSYQRFSNVHPTGHFR